MDVLGISALYHDAAAALVRDGEVIAAAQQERFSRRKHDPSFPLDAIAYCLSEGGVPADGLTAVAYYDKPLTTFVRILKSYVAAGPRGIRTFPTAMSEWTGRKLWTSYEIEKGIRSLGWNMPKQLLYAEHHISHEVTRALQASFASAEHVADARVLVELCLRVGARRRNADPLGACPSHQPILLLSLTILLKRLLDIQCLRIRKP